MQDMFDELRGRRTFQVAAVYAVAAWLAVQVATSTFPYLGFPNWVITAVIIAAIVGFPIALLFAWLRLRPIVLILTITAGIAAVWVITPKGEKLVNFDLTPTTLSQLTSSPEVEEFPAMSPDGKTVVFSRDAGGYKQIFARDLATATETQLTRDSADHIQPSYAPDGKSVLYVQGKSLELADVFGAYSGGDVWQLDTTRGQPHKIIKDAYNPAFLPDATSACITCGPIT